MARSAIGEFCHVLFVWVVSAVAGGLAVGAFLLLQEIVHPDRVPDSELVWLIPAMSLEGIGIFFGAAITTGLKLGSRHLAPEERPTALARLRRIRLGFLAASGAVIALGGVLAILGGSRKNLSQWGWLVLGALAISYAAVSWLKNRDGRNP